MNRKEYKNKLKAWEAEGYDVSELREKWFPHGKNRVTIWLSTVLVIIIVASGVVIWQLLQNPEQAPTTMPTPAPTPVTKPPTTTAAPPTTIAPSTSTTPASPTPTPITPTNTTTPSPTTIKPPVTTTAQPPSTLEPRYGGVLRIITPLDPSVLGDPTMSAGRATFYQYCVLERLVVYAPDVWETQRLQPHLATSWEISNDMKTYTFGLRQGVKFHDGTDWNAEACKWNMDLMKDAGTSATFNDMFLCQVIDDYTVRINFNEPNNTFLTELAVGKFFISPTAYKINGKDWVMDNPVGTGPFKLAEVMRGTYVKYERFDNYWQSKQPYLDGIEFIIIPDATVASVMMQNGKADMWIQVEFEDALELANKGFTARYLDKQSPQGIWPEAQDPESVWRDRRVREALEYAIDREAIVGVMGLGSGWVNVMFQAPIGPEDPAYREGWGRFYDPDKAKQLLMEAGYPNGFKTDIYINEAKPIMHDVAIMVQSYLANVGINVDINIISPGQYMSYLLFGWPTGSLLMSGIPNEPIPHFVALRDYRCSDLQNPKWNHSTVTTPEMCALYNELLAATNPEAIEAAYVALSHQAMDDAVGCYLMDWPEIAVFSDYVHTDWISYSNKVWNANTTWMEQH